MLGSGWGARNSYWRSGHDESQRCFKVMLALLYKRTSKERRKGNPPTPISLSLYTLRLPPSNHPLCSDVPSEYPTMIWHTTNPTLINTTTPQHLTSQHLRPLHSQNTLYHHHLHVYPCLRLSVTLIPSLRLVHFLSTFPSITHNLNCDTNWLPLQHHVVW